MKKKILRFMLIVVTVVTCLVALSMTASAATTKEGILPFEDVKDGSWYADAAEFCYVNDVIDGMNEYTFGGSATLTRAQFVTMLANIDGVNLGSYSTSKFTDVKSGNWFYGAVSWAYNKGFIPNEIITNNKFQPNAVINRETLCAIMHKYMSSKSYGVYVDSYDIYYYDDYQKISSWAEYAMAYMVSSGLIQGTDTYIIDPQGSVTRAQVARILMVYLEDYHYDRKCYYYNHSYSSATCTESRECVSCGIKDGLPLGHSVNNSHTCKSGTQAMCSRCLNWVSGSSMPHEFAPATCAKPETCVRCGETRGKATGKHTWWAATCTKPKMCKVCYKTEGKALGHNWKRADCVNPKRCVRYGCNVTEGKPLTTAKQHTWWAATCTKPKMCKVCYITSGSALGHSWKAADCTAPKTCRKCKLTQGKALTTTGKHTWWAATCTNPKMCKVCYKTEGKALGHNWKAADCTAPKTCTKCKLTQGKALSTTGKHTWWAATCTKPKMCKVCYKTEGKALGHNWKRADCVNPKRCVRYGCNVTEGKPLTTAKQHTWWAATCTKPKMCKVCHITSGSALGHSWKAATCTTAKTCKRCNIKSGKPLSSTGTHQWWAATCTNPKTCKICYTTVGSKSTTNHAWEAATCTSPKTCTRCYKTSGYALGHNYSAATCTKPKTCTRCGGTSGSALGHTTYDGTCSRCNTYVSVADQCKLYLYDDLPKLLIDYNWSGYIDEAVYITDVQYQFTSNSDGTVDLDLSFEGYKNYDDDGSYYSSSFQIAWKLYDQYGYVVDSGNAYTPSICKYDSFRDVKDYLWDLEPGVYYLDLLNLD